MRKGLLTLGTLTTLGTAFVATSHCCERINVLAAMGLVKAGCMGLSQYRGLFMIASLLSFALTLGLALYGPGSPQAEERLGWSRTAGLTLLATVTGLFLFVIP